MSFRFYTDLMSQASKSFARWMFVAGLLLVGFGVVIIAFPEVFAFLAAMVFFVAGVGCGITAVKIFLAQRHFDKISSDDSDSYRKNVQIHTGEHFDL